VGDQTQPETANGGASHVTAVVTLIGVAVAAALSLTTFLFTLFPEWRPDPRERSDATVQALALDKNVTQEEYFKRIGLPKSEYAKCTPQQLAVSGNVVYFQAQTAGFKRSEILVRWFTYDADNKRRIQAGRSDSEKTKVFKPRAPIDRQIAEVWIPTDQPEDQTKYFIRFELYSGSVLRAFDDTKKFTVPPRHPGPPPHVTLCKVPERGA
jgi:hypothetical protein